MDAADEIPLGEKRPRFDGETETSLHSRSVTKVLDDDNLLREIIVRVGFPTTLVRAALVCKRWLDHASDPKFLIRFRRLHPPRLLGYYISEASFLSRQVDATHSVMSVKLDGTRFIPMLPQPPELAGVIRRLESYNLGTHQILHCSGADDASGIYLINLKKFQLCIWLLKGDNWSLIDTICLNEMSILGMSDHTLEDEDIANLRICQVGDNGQFVFLQMGKCIFYLDIRRKTMCKVYENTVENRGFADIHPVMMMWPPTFPALNGDRASKLLDGQ